MTFKSLLGVASSNYIKHEAKDRTLVYKPPDTLKMQLENENFVYSLQLSISYINENATIVLLLSF